MKNFRLALLCAFLAVCLAVCASAFTATLYEEDGKTVIKNGESDSFTFTVNNNTPIPAKSDTESRYFLGYVTADGKQNHKYNIHTEYEGDLTLTARYLDRYDMVPGENVVKNGDFDEDYINVTPSNGTLTIVTEKDGNRVLEYSRGSTHASIQHFMKWEIGRKYRVSYRYKIPFGATIRSTINARYFESQEEINDNDAADNQKGSVSGKAGEWISHSLDFDIPSTCISHYKRDALSLYSEPLYPKDSGEDRFGLVYYDDISIIPYHKITYNANGGTLSGSNTAYQLDGIYTVDASIVPARAGYIFLGWGRNENASVSVSEVELSGEDVELYARWQSADNQPVFLYSFTSEVKGIADGAMSIVAKDEAEGYTDVTLYYADANGILEEYTPLKTLAITDGVATYGVSGKRSFPMEATKIHVVFSAEGKEDYTYVYDIPADKRITQTKKPLYSFYSVSDAHNMEHDYGFDGRTVTYNRNNAINDMIANKDKYQFIVLNGDNVSHSKQADFAKFDAFLDKFKEAEIPLFFNNGNHEFHVGITENDKYSEKPRLNLAQEEIFLEMLDEQEQYLEGLGYVVDRSPGEWYYSVEIEGTKFIFCATPYPNYSTDGADYEISGEQLIWVENQLFDAEKSNKPVFLLSHVGLHRYIPYANGGLSNAAQLEEVLNRHANLFMGSAHSHTNITYDVHTVVAGNQKTQFTHYNEGSMTYTVEYNDDGSTVNTSQYSIGYFIEVYDDMVVFKGRKFDDEEDGGCKYISHAHYQIMLPDADKSLPELAIDGKVSDGSTLTPVLSKTYSSDVSSYEWYINGKVVSTNKDYVIDVNSDTCGKYVACRVNFEDGTFVSALSEKIPGYQVTYDINGGTGTVPSVQDVVPQAEFVPVTPVTALKMEGKYFAGWSVNKDAAEPDESFVATGNMTLYAVYKEGYTVTYNANGGSGTVPENVVVPKGAYKPEVSKSFPVMDGKYFKGWADAADAAVPMATVNIIKDTTLYAVYTDEPKWYFSANLSGFAPGSAVTAYDVKDGYMHYSNKNTTNSDVIFENKNTFFNAEDYPYVRVKLSNEYNGAPTGGFNSIFFKSPTSGYSGTLTRIPPGSAVAKIGDMSVLEVYIPDVSSAADNYHGKISAVRFDPVEKLGATGYADYVVFTNKKGIYKADVTVDDNGNVTLSDETKNCSASAAYSENFFGNTLTVTLTPDEGYEFTTPEDVVIVTTINGKNPDGAVVLSDGSARIWVSDEKEIAFGSSSEAATEVKVDINTRVENKDIVVAVYSNHGTKLEGLRVYSAQTADFDDLKVKIADSLNADTVRVFVFDNLNSIAPACRPFEAVFR